MGPPQFSQPVRWLTKNPEKPDPTPTGHCLLQRSQNCHQLITMQLSARHNYILSRTNVSLYYSIAITSSLTFRWLPGLERRCDQEGVVGTRTVC